MTYPLVQWTIENPISFMDNLDISGTIVGEPTLAIDSLNNNYFAVIVKGYNTTASPSVIDIYQNTGNIAVGCVDANGTLIWYKLFNELCAITEQSSVSMVIGNNNDMYVAFSTLGGVNGTTGIYNPTGPPGTPGYVNMANVPIFCPCPNPGQSDIVLARIDLLTQTVAWIVQNASINSRSNEYSANLAIDTTKGLLYIAYQTNGNILCNPPISSQNVVLVCFNLNGVWLWLEEGTDINCIGTNQTPVVTADLNGGVYLAYTTNNKVSGGATHTTQQVEVVKYQTYLTPTNTVQSYSRQWILSGIPGSNIFSSQTPSPTTCTFPSITYYGGLAFLTFLTSGRVNGNSHTASSNDLVVCAITTTGQLQWLKQGYQFNPKPPVSTKPQYTNCVLPYITTDGVGSIYVSLITYITTTDLNIYVFKLKMSDGTNLFSFDGFKYLPVAYTDFITSQLYKNAVLPTSPLTSFSQVILTATGTTLNIILGTKVPVIGQTKVSTPPNSYDLALIQYTVYIYYPVSPFDFMSQNKKICTCGANCSCSSA